MLKHTKQLFFYSDWVENEPGLVVCYILYNYKTKPANTPEFLQQIWQVAYGRFEFVRNLGFHLIQDIFEGNEEQIRIKLVLIGFSMGGKIT